VAARLGLAGIPVAAETIALATMLQLARETGARVHVTRMSSAAGLDMIDAARAAGIDVTCDVAITTCTCATWTSASSTPHAASIPPLRSQRDREALRAGLAEGAINALCSDHTPVDDDGKQMPFDEAEVGATGLELLLPLTLKWAQEMKLPLLDGAGPCHLRPGAHPRHQGRHLAVGRALPTSVSSIRRDFKVTRENLRSQGKNTPFLGWTATARPAFVRYTLMGCDSWPISPDCNSALRHDDA
jgi:dihydroorotase